MSAAAARLGGGFLALAAIWIGVYWLWEPSRSGGVSFAETEIQAPGPDAIVQESSAAPAASRTEESAPIETLPPPAITADPAAGADPPVVPPEFRDYTVRDNDTFERISRRLFGTIRHAGAIAASNPFVSPTTLREGDILRVPVDPENIQGRHAAGVEPEMPEPEFLEYIVVKGDTLSEIAQRFYGSLRYADVIFNANRDVLKDMDDISLGDVLRIPSRESVLGAERGADD